MLEPVEDGAAIVICNTCRFSADEREDEQGQRGGALLVQALHKVQQDMPETAHIHVQQTACLFACAQHCAVHLRAPGKVGYVLGRFAPDEASARALLEFASHYARSKEGQVRYADWPEGVKGHFITRTPPAGFVTT